MATKSDENVFASPWNDSDMVLVVEDQELHVHKSFLTVLSPVFNAMLDGHFKESSEDKINLEGKNLKSMVLFLQVLYPSSMFEKPKAPLNDEGRLSVMALAEEYQCVNLIKQCIDKAKITPANVLEILPYASKYHPTALSRMYDVINWCAPASKLEEVLPTLESKETSIKMLLTKCRFLESSIVEMQDGLFSLLYDCLKELKEYKKKFSSNLLDPYEVPPVFSTKKDYRCLHAIKIREINEAKYCIHCEEKYKKEFFAPVPSCRKTQHYFDMLLRGNDITTAVKQKK